MIGPEDTLVMLSDQASNLFGLTRRDLGRPIRELEVSYQPLALRGHLDQVIADRKPARVSEVEFNRPGGLAHWFEVHLAPILEGSELLGVSVVFHDVSAIRALRQEVERASRQLESTNAELQSTNEELDTMNEELQSADDELQVINEAVRAVPS